MTKKKAASKPARPRDVRCSYQEMVPIEKLVPNPRNPNGHPQSQVEALAKIIKHQGWRSPIVVSKRSGFIVAGHGRYEAAKLLGLSEVPVDRQAFATEADEYAHLVADNRLAELSEMDTGALAELLESIKGDIDLELTGFDEEAFNDLLGGTGSPSGDGNEGTVTDPPADPVTKPGDLFVLGENRLLCGDATNKEDVERLLAGAKPNLMVTDPPYGVGYDANWRNEAAEAGLIAHADRRVGPVDNDDRADWSEAWRLFGGNVAYVWHAPSFGPRIFASLAVSGFEDRALICWAKPRFAISRGHYHHQHEAAYYVVRQGATASWIGDRSQTTLWEISLDENLEGEVKHSTQKPVECMERPIRNHEGDVYDPFLGSGTTLVAAIHQGRKCYGLEINPAYCDVIIKRWLSVVEDGTVMLNGKDVTRRFNG